MMMLQLDKKELVTLIKSLPTFNEVYTGYLSILRKVNLVELKDDLKDTYVWLDETLLEKDEETLTILYSNMKKDLQKTIHELCEIILLSDEVAPTQEEMFIIIQGLMILEPYNKENKGITPKHCNTLVEMGLAKSFDTKTWYWHENLQNMPIEELCYLYHGLKEDRVKAIKQVVSGYKK
jgi:hypothetical protein